MKCTTVFGRLDVRCRRRLFFGVCIWARLALAAAVYALSDRPWLAPLLVGAAAASFARTLSCAGDDAAWWSRDVHAVLSATVAFAAFNSRVDRAAWILVLDVAIGFATAAVKRPFG